MPRLFPSASVMRLGTAGLVGLCSLFTPSPGLTQTWGRPTQIPPPVWSTPGPETVYDNDPTTWAPRAQTAPTEAQLNQRCNMGRLVGGLIGGGVGYATSRQDGRSWAIPLGALLGSQMGCNMGSGRSPVPW